MERIKRIISGIFNHDCDSNKKCTTKSYIKDGNTGLVFSLGKEYECEKCGKKLGE